VRKWDSPFSVVSLHNDQSNAIVLLVQITALSLFLHLRYILSLFVFCNFFFSNRKKNNKEYYFRRTIAKGQEQFFFYTSKGTK
jgi:hypothetical protein